MGIYDRDYYRTDRRFSAPFHGESSVTIRLIAINIFMVLVQLATLERNGTSELQEWLALNRRDLLSGQIWRLVTYGFCHDLRSPYHILYNMVALWFFGRMLEPALGSREFALFYLAGLMVAGLAHLAFAGALLPPDMPARLVEEIDLIGASGAVLAVLAMCALLYPRQKVILLVFPIELRWLVALYVIMDAWPVFVALRTRELHGNVSHLGHLGGLAWGGIYYFMALRLSRHLPTWEGLRKLLRPRPRLRVHREADEPELRRPAGPLRVVPTPLDEKVSLESRVDEILAKIYHQGEASLTSEERQVLKDASERYKRR